MGKVHPDLERERSQATFDVSSLTHVLDGGEENTIRRRRIENLVLNDPDFKAKESAYLENEETYADAVRINALVVKKLRQHKLTDPQEVNIFKRAAYPHMPLPFRLHDGMFMQTIKNLTTPEQRRKWLRKAENYQIIGTYAQTELGHGTFLRGLETTAHYDVNTQEFILNTPTLTAYKWWPGNLGKTANHAVVMALLYINGRNYGMQPFFVPLRSLDTHASLLGVTLGDIGPKFGFSSNDNGFLKLENVRIPRDHMLMNNAQVHADGTFVQSKSSKLTYGTMVFVRANMLKNSAIALAECCVIATRYSAVRHQTELRPGYEPQILYYQTQQYKLMPQIAASYAFWFVADYTYAIYERVHAEIKRGDTGSLPELHGLLSGLKSFVTYTMGEGIEVLRMSCGGHGYSHASGIPMIYTNMIQYCTYEGENTVMYLQAARYLMKAYNSGRSRKALPKSVEYLGRKRFDKCLIGEDLNLAVIVAAYEFRATWHISRAADKLTRLSSCGKNQQEAWNMTSIQLVNAAAAHSHMFIVKIFCETVDRLHAPSSVKRVMRQLCQLYAVNGILQNSGDFLQDDFMTSEQLSMLEDKLLELLASLRVNAVALVDAYDFPDAILCSALGRYDGQVYEALYKFAEDSPLNKTDVHESYQKYIRPLIKGDQKSKL